MAEKDTYLLIVFHHHKRQSLLLEVQLGHLRPETYSNPCITEIYNNTKYKHSPYEETNAVLPFEHQDSSRGQPQMVHLAISALGT